MLYCLQLRAHQNRGNKKDKNNEYNGPVQNRRTSNRSSPTAALITPLNLQQNAYRCTAVMPKQFIFSLLAVLSPSLDQPTRPFPLFSLSRLPAWINGLCPCHTLSPLSAHPYLSEIIFLWYEQKRIKDCLKLFPSTNTVKNTPKIVFHHVLCLSFM